ncbi:MAG: di-trans,poly-cis-decaprenylcistransferase [Deltaproteobacteria bacterium]|nr:di-trans,poly-cis-decaprenylcistransferase [Deltaproteobacteria bacterium]
MDGNGRWAKERGLDRLEGHRKGADVVRDITTFARELEIPCLTLYSFSVQNWRRPATEVAGLMALLEDYCKSEHKTLMDNDIKLNTIGQTSRLPPSTKDALTALIEATADNRSMTLTLAIDYGGREEIVAAVRRLAHDVKNKRVLPDKIDETAIETRLDTALVPDPDLLIRTSGEQRLSNFLLWQLAYAELYFTKVRWPDFGREDLAAALCDFAGRERRFGKTGEQLKGAVLDAEEFVMGELPDSDKLTSAKGSGPC